MQNFKKTAILLLKNPKELLNRISDRQIKKSMLKRSFYRLIADDVFLRFTYRLKVGKKLNLENPRDFNEKLQWLKIYDRKPIYSILVDKYAVREYIDEVLGPEYLNTLLDMYHSVDEINWNKLPNKFVLKCTHGSGCNIICADKKKLNINEAIEKLNKWMGTNYYYYGREWPYKNVKPRIICEEFIEDEIVDYKFYCFNGEPKFLYTSHTSKTDGLIKMDFYNMKWEKCDFYRKDHDSMEFKVDKPNKLNEMIKIATKLSKGLKFARIDLFYVREKIYFSEITLTPGSGFTPFSPVEREREIGNMLKI